MLKVMPAKEGVPERGLVRSIDLGLLHPPDKDLRWLFLDRLLEGVAPGEAALAYKSVNSAVCKFEKYQETFDPFSVLHAQACQKKGSKQPSKGKY